MTIEGIEYKGTFRTHQDGSVICTIEETPALEIGKQYDITENENTYTMRHLASVNGNEYKFELPEELRPQASAEERIAQLEAENASLLECVLEMSEIVYA